MCGIAGIVSKRPVNRAALEAMNEVQRHRGPDGEGIWVSADGCVGFAHRRLAILDLSELGSQPMRDATDKLVLCYNGEIYNYVELRRELEAAGAVFRSQSDTEVIIEAYRHWGAECLGHFNGMFAFALYDRERREVLLARDRFGEKPLLFVQKPDFFAFASEYKALLQLAPVGLGVDDIRVLRSAQDSWRALDAERQTAFDDVQQLLPRESARLSVESLRLEVRRYWDIELDGDAAKLTPEDAATRFGELLRDSVHIRMRSDVPVGSCLSGGLDSSSIVCLARQLVGSEHEYHTFTGRFEGTPADEWSYAQHVVDAAEVTAHITSPSPERLADDLDHFVWHNELPVGGTSQFAQWCVFHLAKTHGVTVLLDGQGADELLGGYEGYFRWYVESGPAAAAEAEIIRERYPQVLRTPTATLKTRLPLRVRRFVSRHLNVGTNMLYGVPSDVAAKVQQESVREPDPRFNALADALYHDSFGGYLTTLLRYGDRNSMAHSREVRLPFCDHRIASFVFSLPPGHLMGGAQTKRLLRESMRGTLPEPVRTRWRKQGFMPPQGQWFQGALLDLVEEVIGSPRFQQSPLWDGRWWLKAVARLRAGERDLAMAMWQPFIAEVWRDRFVERIRRSPRVDPLVAA